MTVSAATPPTRVATLLQALGITAAAVTSVFTTFRTPPLTALLSLALLGIALRLWKQRVFMLISACGFVLGSLLEYVATASGLWIYSATSFGRLPLWVFTLWPVVPLCTLQLTRAIAPASAAPPNERPLASVLVGLSAVTLVIVLLPTHGNEHPLACVALTSLGLVALVLANRTPQTAVMLLLAGVVGPLAETLPIFFGAWSYPQGTLLGMPIWLPPGWALFGFGLVKLASGLDGLIPAASTSTEAPGALTNAP